MRYTEKYDGEYGSNISEYELWQKLGQLEDIEEELGIDLITLFKALKNGIYTLGNNDIEPVVLRMFYEEPMLVFETDTTEVYLKGYGKTWALTKEELL